MIQSIFGCLDCVLPINISRQGGKSEISFSLPGSLTIAQTRRVTSFCEQVGSERGGEFEGHTMTVATPEGGNISKSVASISVWSRHETSLCDELQSLLPQMLRAPVVPVIHI